jgi:hypothetical protein
MEKITKEEVVIKPKIYFIVGSVSLGVGIGLIFAITTWFITLQIYKFRAHNLLDFLRYGKLGFYTVLNNFPWTEAFISVLLLATGVYLLKKYDISY